MRIYNIQSWRDFEEFKIRPWLYTKANWLNSLKRYGVNLSKNIISLKVGGIRESQSIV